MDPLELVKLTPLMERTSGSPEVEIGLIEGPGVTQHPDLAGGHLRFRDPTLRRLRTSGSLTQPLNGFYALIPEVGEPIESGSHAS
jgi:hypothetical protein